MVQFIIRVVNVKNIIIKYVTDYGVRYHRDENCSEINRTIIEISRNKVTGMRACRLCAAGDN